MKSTAVLQVDFMLNECLKVMVSFGQNFLLRLCWILETLRKVSVKSKMLVMVMFDRRLGRYKTLRWSVFHSQSYFWNTYASFLQYCCPWSRRSRHCFCFAVTSCQWQVLLQRQPCSGSTHCLPGMSASVSSWAGWTHLSTALHLTDMLSSS